MGKCSSEKLEKAKARRDWLKEHHICVQCGSKDAVGNMTRCEDCLEYQYSHSVSKQKHKEYEQLRRIKKIERGECTRCSKKAVIGRRLCEEHLEKQRAENKKYYNYTRTCTDEELHYIQSECGKRNIVIALASNKLKQQRAKFKRQTNSMFGA